MNNEIKEKIKAYYVANDIDKIIDYITNLQKENEKLENDKRGMLVELYKANQRSEYLQRSCERKEEQMLDYRQDYMEQEDYKTRNEKALDKLYCYGEVFDGKILQQFQQDMINILQGGDENGM